MATTASMAAKTAGSNVPERAEEVDRSDRCDLDRFPPVEVDDRSTGERERDREIDRDFGQLRRSRSSAR